MINPFKLKRYASALISTFIPVISFYCGLIFYNLWIALVFLLCASIVSLLISGLIQKNPFTDMLEGKGILAFSLDSTGIMTPFIMRVNMPYMQGNLFGKLLRDVFNRRVAHTIKAPIKLKNAAQVTKEGGLTIKLTDEELNASRFGFLQYPLIIYNKALDSCLTKDFLSEKESKYFSEHQVMYMNRQMEDLTSSVRDFGRHVVEQLKPAMGILRSPWFWIILIVFIGIMLLLFAPALIGEVKSFVSSSTSTLGGGGTVTPR